jgi:membrane-associated phospholipid phosphatase
MVGALVFFAFPAAPPWLAGHAGLIHALSINDLQSRATPLPHGGSFIASQIPRNPVAAVPSLHAAYALLTLLFARAWRRRVGYAFVLYPIAMWFSIIYLGDHYVVDALSGIALAAAGWWATGRLMATDGVLARLAGPHTRPISQARTFGGSR